VCVSETQVHQVNITPRIKSISRSKSIPYYSKEISFDKDEDAIAYPSRRYYKRRHTHRRRNSSPSSSNNKKQQQAYDFTISQAVIILRTKVITVDVSHISRRNHLPKNSSTSSILQSSISSDWIIISLVSSRDYYQALQYLLSSLALSSRNIFRILQAFRIQVLKPRRPQPTLPSLSRDRNFALKYLAQVTLLFLQADQVSQADARVFKSLSLSTSVRIQAGSDFALST